MTFHPGQLVMCIDGHIRNEVAVLQSGWIYKVVEVWDEMIKLEAVAGFWEPNRFASYVRGDSAFEVYFGSGNQWGASLKANVSRQTDISIFTAMLTKKHSVEDVFDWKVWDRAVEILEEKGVKMPKPVKHAV